MTRFYSFLNSATSWKFKSLCDVGKGDVYYEQTKTLTHTVKHKHTRESHEVINTKAPGVCAP